MILKYYAEVDNIPKAIKYYQSLFDLKIIKDGKDGHHGNIKLFDQVTILLHQQRSYQAKPGYYILRFADNEKDLFIEATNHLRKTSGIKISFDNFAAKWGTTFFEFTDAYGYTWDLEISTKVLKK